MLNSQKIQKRQAEIRTELNDLAANDAPTIDQQNRMEELNTEYRSADIRLQSALTAEDDQRREGAADLETRESHEWSELVDNFEVRQVTDHLNDYSSPLSGQTKEVIDQLRSEGGQYKGLPVPWEAFETRAATTSATVPAPVQTHNIIDNLFPNSVASAMGVRVVNAGSGGHEYPVNTSKTVVGWQGEEGGATGQSTEYTTVNRPLKPNHTLGVTMDITRKAQKQTGNIEQAIRSNMQRSMQTELDRVVFAGNGTDEPLGVISGADTYGIATQAVDAAATYSAFRQGVLQMMLAHAVNSPAEVRALIRPELWDSMDDAFFNESTGTTQMDRVQAKLQSVIASTQGLQAPSGSTPSSSALMTTVTGGVNPIFVGRWGAIDLVRDPYSLANSGTVKITMLATMDITISRPEQLRVLTGLQ